MQSKQDEIRYLREAISLIDSIIGERHFDYLYYQKFKKKLQKKLKVLLKEYKEECNLW